MTTGGADADARAELRELTAALRAQLEWLGMTGATGVPRGEATPAGAVPAAGAAASAPEPAVSRPKEPSLSREHERTAPLAPEPKAPPAPELEPAERTRRLEVLAETVKGCTRCGLAAGRTQTVFARGTGSARLMFVGEGPGADEDAEGFPFVGKAGQLLDRMIAAMGFSRDEVYVANIVKCRPPNNRKPEPEEMAACMPYLAEQIELVAPEVIVALGATAVQGLFGTGEGIMRIRGRWRLYRGRVPVMPTFHPAYLLRTPAAKREVWDDLQAVLRQMGRTAPSRG
jgi:uracil-DNA glycosylase family 4